LVSHLDRKLGRSDSIELPLMLIDQLSGAQSLEETLAAVARWTRWMMDVDRAAITIHGGGNTLKLFVLDGNGAVPLNWSLPLEGTAVGRVYVNRKWEICDDFLKTDDRDRLQLARGGLNSSIVVPLLHGDSCFGTFNVAHRKRGAFNETHLRKIQAIAGWLAANIRIHRQVEQLAALSRIDPLTGLLNRRALQAEIEALAANAQGRSGTHVVAVIDLDHFKSINDSLGHVTGDRALVVASQALRHCCRPNDLTARIGGEEFCAVLKASTRQQAETVFGRFAGRLSEQGHKLAGVSLTASIGAVVVDASQLDLDYILREADHAMYRAKANGRARTEFARVSQRRVA